MQTLTMNTTMVSSEVLNSWKEIATYVGRGVRTVQRWETELGLPVRRPGGKSRSPVIAMRTEIDGWLKACPLEARQTHETSQDSSGEIQPVRLVTQELVLASRLLRQNLQHTRHQLTSALNDFVLNLEKMMVSSRFGDKPVLSPAAQDWNYKDFDGRSEISGLAGD